MYTHQDLPKTIHTTVRQQICLQVNETYCKISYRTGSRIARCSWKYRTNSEILRFKCGRNPLQCSIKKLSISKYNNKNPNSDLSNVLNMIIYLKVNHYITTLPHQKTNQELSIHQLHNNIIVYKSMERTVYVVVQFLITPFHLNMFNFLFQLAYKNFLIL